MSKADDILATLDAFIRKYYKSKAIRGTLYAVGIGVSIYLAAVLLEHYGWLSSTGRALLFWGGLALVLGAVAWLVARPLLKMQGLGRRIGYADAAVIIGKHFPEVSDKLLNMLQLLEGDAPTTADADLLLAAIEQKRRQLKPVPMLDAINLRHNRKYLRYALPPVALLLLLLLIRPQMVAEPTKRIVTYNTVYERPAPFRFVVDASGLSATRGADLKVVVTTEGDARPAEVYLLADGRRHRMAVATGGFEYTLRQLQHNMQLVFEGGGVQSRPYVVQVLPNPGVVSFKMLLNYPAYTGRQPEALVGVGDAAVPEGTTVRWLFQTEDADSLCIASASGVWRKAMPATGGSTVEVQHRLMADIDYSFYAKRMPAYASDTLTYHLNAIADAMPQISVEEVVDSLYPDRRLFRGRIKDDYGFSGLVFVHEVSNPADTTRNATSVAEIALQEASAAQDFYFTFNTAAVDLQPGDRLTYHFAVSDNDAIHGPKTTRSQQFEIAIPDAEELQQLLDRNSTEARQSAEQQISRLQQMQQDINQMMQRLVDKKELSWQDRKDLERIKQQQQEVRQMMQQMRQQIDENNRLEQRYREQSEKLIEKQRELDRLMDQLLDDQMKQTMAEIERMMQEADKKTVQQELEQLKTDNSELEKQIDQNLELMKRLELEKRAEQAVHKAEQLATEQRQLSEESKQHTSKDNTQLQQQQQRLNDDFRQLQRDIEQLQQDYRHLDPSADFKVPHETQQQIEQQQQQAKQSLERGKNNNASQHQRQAADALEQLSQQIEQAQLDMEQQQLAEDADQVRQLLKNLVQLSFNQEELIADVNSTYIQDPRYQTIVARQKRLQDDFAGVEDSLRALAKRQVQVASVVGREVASVGNNIARSLKALIDMNQGFYGSYRNSQAVSPMQYSMTALNNLALVLAESLDRMQDQMRQNSQRQNSSQRQSSRRNQQQCSNPGTNPSPKSMRQMQQELNKQLEAMKKQLDQRGKQQGQRHSIGQQQGMSEELARMAAQQEMIRRMMQEYGQQMKQADANNGALAREIDQMLRQMEQTEADLVNRTITRQTIQRQQQIMTRMLEHEKAEQEREKEQRRQSHEGTDLYSQPTPAEIERYNRQKQAQDEPLRTVPPTLQPFYRQKVGEYFYAQ